MMYSSTAACATSVTQAGFERVNNQSLNTVLYASRGVAPVPAVIHHRGLGRKTCLILSTSFCLSYEDRKYASGV